MAIYENIFLMLAINPFGFGVLFRFVAVGLLALLETAGMQSLRLAAETADMPALRLVAETADVAALSLAAETADMAALRLVAELPDMPSLRLVAETADMPSLRLAAGFLFAFGFEPVLLFLFGKPTSSMALSRFFSSVFLYKPFG
jgi:hypothetical protein